MSGVIGMPAIDGSMLIDAMSVTADAVARVAPCTSTWKRTSCPFTVSPLIAIAGDAEGIGLEAPGGIASFVAERLDPIGSKQCVECRGAPPPEKLMDDSLINLYDFEQAAGAYLPRMAWDYYASGAHDEITLRENHAAFDRIGLHYHVLRDVTERDLSVDVLGQRLSMPILVGPTAFQGLAHTEAECATARAATGLGTIMVMSTLSNATIEDVAAEASGPLWFQLYVYRDRQATVDLIRRVEAAGFSALMLTVDAPVLGRRERDVRNRFQLPPGLFAGNLTAAGMSDLPSISGSGLAGYFAALLDPSLSWDDLSWLRSVTDLPILVKGIVRADDAARAVDAGVAGIVVSNHGGRQLDTAPATIEVLPRIVDAVAGRAEVYVDGGIRRGTDVVKALAFGARAVLIGRPALWGLAVGGEAGVRRVLELLAGELDVALALCGCPSVRDVSRDLIQE